MNTMNRDELLTEVAQDMRELYQTLKDGSTKREQADSLANVAGKRLKAFQLHLADRIFEQSLGKFKPLPKPQPAIAAPKAAKRVRRQK